MRPRRWLAWTLSIAAPLCAGSAVAALPDGCTAADANHAEQYESLAIQELMKGDTQGFAAVSKQMEQGLSKTCRAAMDRDQPMRSRCTTAEKSLALEGYEIMIMSALSGDLQRFFIVFAVLEERLSRPCWLAMNQPEQPIVRRSCTVNELDYAASYAGPMIKATHEMLVTYDFATVLEMQQRMLSELSPKCRQAMVIASQQSQQGAMSPKAPKTPMPLPRVYDHGGGTFSVPGVGACGSGGCMAF